MTRLQTMRTPPPYQKNSGKRRALVFFLAMGLSSSFLLAQNRPPQPHVQGTPPSRQVPRSAIGPRPQQQHFTEWMQQRSQLNPQQQQQALRAEPGFRQLPLETQQRLMNRLQTLNQMPPEQRQRMIDRNEQMERLSPQQRQQVRGALQQLGGLPLDRRRAVARSFRELKGLPPEQRGAVLNSPAYRSQFNEEERSTLSNLMQAEPYIPVQR
ncbi:DUF3106 domain-containing protein [Terriglobus saanensis]|nr:DUF3106 domain-containing protein [Terriglobus saanensis]